MKVKRILTAIFIFLILSVVAVAYLAFSAPVLGAETSATGADGVRISLPTVYGDHMVFQRGKDINVRGYCTKDGEEITVTLGDATASAEALDGEWSVSLPPMEATFGLTLTVARGLDKITISDVSVGEVILVSGQSNAILEAYHLEDLNEHMALIENYDNLRLYTSVPSLSLYESQYGTGSWHLPSREVITTSSEGASRRFSAVGVVVGLRIAEELGPDVPVAVMTAARGASKIRAWLSYDNLALMSPSEAARVDTEREYFDKNNKYTVENLHVQYGTSCYNTMIAPLRGFNVAGVVWYQGEGDAAGQCFGTEGNGYTKYFATMTSGFREILGGDDNLPFFMIQLASYSLDNQDAVYNIKAEQYDICEKQDNVYLVPIMTDDCTFTTKDAIAQMFIHPSRKSPVGNRVALTMLEELYGIKDDMYVGMPKVVSVSKPAADNLGQYRVTVTFDRAVNITYGDVVEGFQVYNGTLKKWVDVVGEITAENKVRLIGMNFKPQQVRYGYGKPIVELESGERFALSKYYASYGNPDEKSTYTGVLLTSVDGKQYNLDADSLNAGAIIKMYTPGNLSGASGTPLPIFTVKI